MSIIVLKICVWGEGGKYFFDLGFCDAHIIQGPDLDLKYKLSRFLISSKTTSFSMFTNTLLMNGINIYYMATTVPVKLLQRS